MSRKTYQERYRGWNTADIGEDLRRRERWADRWLYGGLIASQVIPYTVLLIFVIWLEGVK